MLRIRNILAIGLTLIVVGCAQEPDQELSHHPITPATLPEEKNVIGISRKTPPLSLYQNFTFPSDFHGSVKFEWIGVSAVKPGPSSNVNLECNYAPLLAMQ